MGLLVVGCAIFSIGFYGVLVRRDIVAILANIEVMLGGGLILLVGLGAGSPIAAEVPRAVEGIALLVIVVAAAEAAVGLSLLVALARRSGRTRIDEIAEVRD